MAHLGPHLRVVLGPNYSFKGNKPICDWHVPLTQALGAQTFFGSNGCARNVSRRNFGATARLAFQTVDRQRQCIGNLNFPELASQSACRPPPTSLATNRQRQVPANSRAIPGSKIICYASLTTQSRGTAIVPMSVPLFPALGPQFGDALQWPRPGGTHEFQHRV